tara:strand:- start:44108 stop:44428 length:321 start_codon:yes stop_codon:yes gene_type:complete
MNTTDQDLLAEAYNEKVISEMSGSGVLGGGFGSVRPGKSNEQEEYDNAIADQEAGELGEESGYTCPHCGGGLEIEVNGDEEGEGLEDEMGPGEDFADEAPESGLTA